MKLNGWGWLVGLLAGASLPGGAQEERVVVHAVSGGGHRVYDAEMRTFAFSAVQYRDGSASGEVEIVNRDQGNCSHGVVTCLRVVDNEAVIMFRFDDHSAFPGSIGLFAVRDNGEGRAAGPDEITYAYPFDPPGWGCDAMLDQFWHLTFHMSYFPLVPIEKGNIQVR